MTPDDLIFLAAAVLVVAFLYSSVGHAGASGYIAVMTLFGMMPAAIKPTALTLNILVACLTAWNFWRAGYFSWKLFWPFAVLSIPCAFLGGYLNLPTHLFKILVGIVLWFSAVRLLIRPASDEVKGTPSHPAALSIGAGLGLLSGLTGTGGGIFLTPLLILMKWARVKSAGAVSALFILVNSTAGLLGNLSNTRTFPVFAIILAVAVVIGGSVGSYFGSHRFPHTLIRQILAGVLLLAGVKLIFTQ
jgi:uncharacterized protein